MQKGVWCFVRHEFKSITNKQTYPVQFCPSPLNHWCLPSPLHNCAHTASHTAMPWVRRGNWCSSGLCVLGVTGMESAFFMAAGMVLCCEFGSRTVSVIRQCFTYSWPVFAQHQSLFFFPYSGSPASKLQLWEAGKQHSQSSWPEGYSMPYGIAVRSKNWGKKEEEGTSRV